jgi:conjugal transfer pilus assembly protein TraV
MMRFRLTGAAAVFAGTLSGCASLMSGIGGSERYACKAPEGVTCTSVSGAYANSTHGTPQAAQLPAAKRPSPPTFYGATSIAPGGAGASMASATRIRSNPRLLRVWVAPWEDSDGDLHEEAIVHVIVDSGRWLIDHVRPAPRSRIDAVAPPLPVRESAAPALPADVPVSGIPLPLPPGVEVVPGTNMTTGER